jgi:predicted  nucleic acid-binding Zn-ribbon protein
MLERRLRAYELALDTARRDAVQAAQTLAKLSARIAELELELSAAREQPATLETRLADQQRARRAAEQRAYSERAYREELQIELAELEREREHAAESLKRVSVAATRERELEEELSRLRRFEDEAEQMAAADRSARDRAERRVVELTDQLEGLSGEVVALRGRVADLTEQLASAPMPPPADEIAGRGRLGHVLVELRDELATLRRLAEREGAARDLAEQQVAELTEQLRVQSTRTSLTVEAIGDLREHLAKLAGLPDRSEQPPPAPRSFVLHTLPAEPAAGPIEPGRFEAALARLRQATEDALGPVPFDESASDEELGQALLDSPDTPEEHTSEPDPEPEPAPEPQADVGTQDSDQLTPLAGSPVTVAPGTQPWIGRALAKIAGREPETAGGLVLELLVAQRAAHPEPIAYDIDLTGMPCLHMTITPEGQRLQSSSKRRPAGQVAFSVVGDLESFGRLMVARGLKRRFSRKLAKVNGDRAGVQALDAILAMRLTIPQLRELGFRIDPILTLKLTAAMINPGWTAGSTFTIGYAEPGAASATGDQELPGLVVNDGSRVVVASLATPRTTISCDPDDLPALLNGAAVANFECEGQREPLVRVQRWMNRAQSGG